VTKYGVIIQKMKTLSKVKVVPMSMYHASEVYGGQEVRLHSFLSSALCWGEWSALWSGHLPMAPIK